MRPVPPVFRFTIPRRCANRADHRLAAFLAAADVTEFLDGDLLPFEAAAEDEAGYRGL